MAASKTCLLLLALVALATVSTTVEAGQPAKHGKPTPAPRIYFSLVLDLQLCPVQLEVSVASAVVAAEQTRQVCPGGRRTALKKVEVDVAVEAVVALQVDVLNKHGKVVDKLTVVLDVKELAVVKGNEATVVLSVVLDVQVKEIRFVVDNKVVHILQLTVEALAALQIKP